MLGSHTEWAPLEKSPYSSDAGPAGQDHHDQPDEANQTSNVENLRHRAKFLPFDHHGASSIS